MESAAHLDCYRCLNAIEERHFDAGIALLTEIVAMLTKLCIR